MPLKSFAGDQGGSYVIFCLFSFRDKLSFRRKDSPAMKSKFGHGGGIAAGGGGIGQISAPSTPEVPRRNSSG
jgi:hypothetical protein